ncbi:MAG: DUF917 family protein [Streptosporangiales bacterium]|nr:DUF917 family protein [Streptosporangiales bacterium]
MGEAVAAPITQIGVDDIEHLVLGAQLVSSGGATIGTVPSAWLRRTLAGAGPVRLVPVSDLSPETLCVPVGNVGSPTVLEEKLPAGEEFVHAVRGIEDRLGTPAGAVAALDVASINALTPVIAAAQLGLPLVDADGMGRMFPLIELTVWAAAGLPASPITLVNTHGDVITIDCADNQRIESLARPAIIALGGWCAAALYPMNAATLARHGIHGSFSQALRLGRTLAEAQERGSPRGADLARELGARLLFTGAVVEVSRPTAAGFARGVVVIADRTDPDRMLRLEVQNECLLALVDGRVAAAVPDVICPIEQGSCLPVGVEQLYYGQVLDVLCFAADPAWHTPEGLALAGPAAFGYPLPNEAPPGDQR